jgi:hypothetical protein
VLPDRYSRIYTKAPGNNFCNICEQNVHKLTEDHVPPECCLLDPHVQLEPFEHRLQAKSPVLPISQSGIRYRTICGPCNSFLGREYDKALKQMCRAVAARLGSVISVAPQWSIWCRPDRVIRALMGHFLAASTDDAQAVPDTQMRPAVRDPTAPLPDERRVFYWLHPWPEVCVTRGIGMPGVRGRFGPPGVFDIIKFPPLGFLMTELDSYEGLPRLDLMARGRGDREVEVRFHNRLVHEWDWPERVGDDNLVMFGRSVEDGVVARPHTPKRRKRSKT